nr:immunoglobulin light chain junction region [Macaca mulatta]MOV65014.1 immunoglobulin light chain junction region [Macaca mulatta]
CQQNSGGPTF